jgi:hypothetical protein
MSRPHLDWEWLMEAYNNSKGTCYEEVKPFIIQACKKHGVNEFARLMGIGTATLNVKRRNLKIRKIDLDPGFKLSRDILIMLSRSGRMEHMTRREIMNLTGFSGSWISAAAKKYELKYIKTCSGNRWK